MKNQKNKLLKIILPAFLVVLFALAGCNVGEQAKKLTGNERIRAELMNALESGAGLNFEFPPE